MYSLTLVSTSGTSTWRKLGHGRGAAAAYIQLLHITQELHLPLLGKVKEYALVLHGVPVLAVQPRAEQLLNLRKEVIGELSSLAQVNLRRLDAS